MRNMAVLHSPAFSYPLPVLVRVLFNPLIFKGKILYYNKYKSFVVKTLVRVGCLLLPLLIYPLHGYISLYVSVRYVLKDWLLS